MDSELDPVKVVQGLNQAGIARTKSKLMKFFVSALMSGLFLSIGTIFAYTCAGGLNADFRRKYPSVPKIISGATYHLGLQMIISTGSELFTGSTMFLTSSLLSKNTKVTNYIKLLLLSLLGNIIGCVVADFLFGWVTDAFVDEPFKSFLLGITKNKVNQSFHSIIFKSIAANILVCVAIFQATGANSAAGKWFGISLPIMAFVTIGFEHSIANFCVIPLGLMYGADVEGWRVFVVLLLNVLGNWLSGAFLAMVFDYLHSDSDTNKL